MALLFIHFQRKDPQYRRYPGERITRLLTCWSYSGRLAQGYCFRRAKWRTESYHKICTGQVVLQHSLAKLSGNFFLVNSNNAGPVCIRFYHPDKTDKIDRLIHASGSKMAFKMTSVVKQLMYVLKLFRVTAGSIHSFRICSKETLRIMYLCFTRPLALSL